MKNNKSIEPDINYFTVGKGTPAILIHGMAGSCKAWYQQIPALVAAGYQVFALDLPGHGDSPKPVERGAYHIDVVYDQLIAWIRSLNLEEPALFVGHSMGGYLSFRYAIEHSQAVRGMVLIDPFYSLDQLYPLIRLSARRPRLSAAVFRGSPDWAVRSFVTLLKRITVEVPRQALARMLTDLTRASHRILYTAPTVRNLFTSLPEIRAPALVIWGQRDLTLHPDTFPAIVEAMPNASGVEITEAGHTPHMSNPDDFNPLMISFLEKLSSSTAVNGTSELPSNTEIPQPVRPIKAPGR